jgi:hypothetical protein
MLQALADTSTGNIRQDHSSPTPDFQLKPCQICSSGKGFNAITEVKTQNKVK